jgi:NAD+ synthase (glutamine-hydrolysing)
VRLALAQVNPCVGDLHGNVERCLQAIDAARSNGADLVVLPEMAVPGCPPRDILLDPSFVRAVSEANADLALRTADGPPVLAGTLVPSGRRVPDHPGLYNAAVLLDHGSAHLVAAKRLLPNHDVFFESRWFLPGPALPPVAIAGTQIGVLLSADLRDEGHEIHPGADLVAAGADLLVCLAASPYQRQVEAQRLHHARRQRCPVAYANLSGANDELIFDGRSFVLDAEGNLVARLDGFKQQVRVIDLDAAAPVARENEPAEQELYRALVLGVRDFCHKNAQERAFLGLSGGIDSAVVAAIAAAALGPDRVTAVAIPSRYTDPRSTTSARDLARALSIGFEVVELERLHAAVEDTLRDHILLEGTTAENVQPRLRAMILMGLVNRRGGLLINTSNKTEIALGYATVYGDTAGTLCPIGDLTKPEVFALGRWIDAQRGVIPPFILERPPTAELRPDQVDPFDYPTVSPAMEQLVRGNRSNLALRRSEHKRWHMGVILKVSPKAFGTGRLIPITRR